MMRWSDPHARWSRVFRCEAGSASVEYAVVLGLLVLAASGTFLLGEKVEGVFDAVSQKMTARPSSAPSAAEGADTSAAPLPGHAGDSTTRARPRGSPLGGVVVAVGGAVLAAGVCWMQLRRRKRPAIAAAAAEEPSTSELQRQLYAKRQQLLRLLGNDSSVLLQNRMEVRHLMTCDLVTVPPTASRDQLLTLMSEKRVRHLLVCGADGDLLGVISNRDLHRLRGATAREFMTTSLRTVRPGAPLSPVITLLLNAGISCLPVVEDGRLCGVLTTTDLLLTLQGALQFLLRMAHYMQHDPLWNEQLDALAETETAADEAGACV
jgi:CBS domain-containing protein/Flp pilus assembly pilin Flp